MKFVDHKKRGVEFAQMDPFVAQMVRLIPASADPEENEAVLARLYSLPSAKDEDLQLDWQEYVKPDLKTEFDAATTMVSRDLQTLLTSDDDPENECPWRLTLPSDHVDAWLNALNQARLALAARHDFSDEELAGDFRPQLVSPRDLALYQIAIYGWMQELLITTL